MDEPVEAESAPACQEKRNPDGTWPKGVSGNPKGPPKGYVRLSYWMQLYASGASIDHAPAPAREFVYAAFRDASMRPDGSGGCAATRKLVLDRHDGPVKTEIEANVTSVERKIVIVGTTSIDPPPLPESVLRLEEAREAAEDQAQVRRVIEARGVEGDED